MAKSAGVDWIGLVAPTSGPDRVAMIAREASGFVYVISVTGITGIRRDLPGEYVKTVEMVKRSTDIPVVVGFGISTPEMASSVAEHCDGVVIGSACVSLIEKYSKRREYLVRKMSSFIEKTKLRLINGAF
jgi:tryptophan synthase alpha chain